MKRCAQRYAKGLFTVVYMLLVYIYNHVQQIIKISSNNFCPHFDV
jgi:hypothetical protein